MANDYEDYDEKPVVSKKTRLGVLIGLGLVACLVALLIGGLYISKNRLAFSQASPTQLVVRSTATMIVIPTSTVTQTAAPIPYEQLIPEGWVQIKSELVEIWVPASFKSMNIAKFTATAEAQSEKTGIGLGESEGTVDLVLLDDRQRQSLTSVAVYISFVPRTYETLDAYVDASNADRPEVYRTVELSKVRVGGYDAIRELVELSYQAKQTNIVTYLIQAGDTVWIVEFTCHILDFYEQLPDFEKSIQTFRTIQ